MLQLALHLSLLSASLALPLNSVGRLPTLGWNSWNAFHCGVDEEKVLSAANSFISLGLKDAGYVYVNIDDCWSDLSGRDSQGRIQPNLTLFPDGIAGTAQKVHDMGLMLGLYSDAGTKTCAGYPASLGTEDVDAQTFADWGVDYLKYDNCNVPANWTDAANYTDWSQSNTAQRFRQMSDAIQSLPSPMFFEICDQGSAMVWTWGATIGQSWRMTDDIQSNWDSIMGIVKFNVMHLDTVDFFAHNDMDMMEIGNGDLTIQEQRSHFAIWAFLKSPILLGTELDKLSDEQVAIVTNPELLAFSQDPTIGEPAMPFGDQSTSPPEFYSGTSTKGTHVFVLNTADASANKTVTFADVPGLEAGTGYVVHDMWTGSDVGTFTDEFSVLVEAHDTGAWLVTAA